MQSFASEIWALGSALGGSFLHVLRAPFDPYGHLFAPYLVTSLVAAGAVYALARRRGARAPASGLAGCLRFIFPREIWRHPSARVDLRYFVPHQMVRFWIYGPSLGVGLLVVANATHAFAEPLVGAAPLSPWVDSVAARLAVTLVAAIALDFVSYLVHYAQHRVPILWEFHRVHHSAVAANPLANYREHPVDNVLYAAALAVTGGVVSGAFLALFGAEPTKLGVAGIALPALLFNVLGYHLRHSHIWLRWPDPLAWCFGCPAHHQIHHSCEPEHIDKNFAFYFPVWDLLFGTLCLPRERPKLTWGLGDGSEHEYRSFARIYALPFVRLARRERGRRAGGVAVPEHEAG